VALIPENPQQKFLLELLKALGLPPDLNTKGVWLDLQSFREEPTARVDVVLSDDQSQRVIKVLLCYRFRITEIEVGKVIDLTAEKYWASQPREAVEEIAEAGELSERLNKLIADQVANLRAEIEGNMTKIIAPLVARAGGSVTLSAEDLGRPWSLSVLGLPGGDVTLVAVVLDEGQRCRVCGCTSTVACPGGCSWVEPDLCSQCVGKEGP
jgi:phosphoribosylformylglycinamidine (FGAM) synthase PurS component